MRDSDPLKDREREGEGRLLCLKTLHWVVAGLWRNTPSLGLGPGICLHAIVPTAMHALWQTTVPIVSLSDEIHEHVTLLKLDVQGAEPDVIDGAQRLIRTYGVDVIHMEFQPVLQLRMGRDPTRYVLTRVLQSFAPACVHVSLQDRFSLALTIVRGLKYCSTTPRVFVTRAIPSTVRLPWHET